MDIPGACYRILSEIVHAFTVPQFSTSSSHNNSNPNTKQQKPSNDDLMLQALTAVFGMQSNGKIRKERARQVVDNLGLVYSDQEDKASSDEVPVEEALNGLKDKSKRKELLLEAFKIFDEDGDGFIEAIELKRVLQCLGLDKGWDISQIQRMLQVVDLNLDGKVDFAEFELMMGDNC